MHDMTRSQPFKYRLSYIISALYSTILLIELARAYNLLKKRYTKEEVEHFIGHEYKQMHNYWTSGLKQKAKDEGNTYMLRDRVRWTLFQLFVAGLQMLPVAQIFSIFFVQLTYVIITNREFKQKRIMQSFWHKLKFICQDYAILFFLAVLCVFALTEGSSFQ
jgi:hypothetical protein